MPKVPLAKDKKTDYFYVDSRKLIEEEGYNEREEWGDLEGLAAEILAVGIQQALIVNKRGDQYAVRSGHRRRKACKLLEEMGHAPIMVPVILERRGSSPEERVLHLITDNSGLAFTPWERAKVLRRLRNFGWSDDDIAERSGISLVYVRRLLSLADAPQKLINLVREKRVSATLAMERIAEGGVDDLLQKAETNELPSPNAELDLFPTDNKARTRGKVTAKDLQPHDSVKLFKKWAPKMDEKQIAPEKAPFFKFLRKMIEGKLTEDDIKKFFK